jgi:hypothetical protein
MLCRLGAGAEVDLMALFVRRHFGLRAFGAICGLTFAIFLVDSNWQPEDIAIKLKIGTIRGFLFQPVGNGSHGKIRYWSFGSS